MNEFVTLTSSSEWFKQHPEKVAGTEEKTTSRAFPFTIKGTKEDVVAMFSFLDKEKHSYGDEELLLLELEAEAEILLLELLQFNGIGNIKGKIYVGKLTEEIARQIRREAGDVFLDQKGITHIKERHSEELEQIGFTAIDFVKYVLSNFNEVRQARGSAIFLIVSNGLSKTACIRLFGTNEYHVETAAVMRKSFFNEKKLLWKRERTP